MIEVEGELTNNNFEVAEKFNKFFTEIGKNVTHHLNTEVVLHPISEVCENHYTITEIYITAVTEDEIINVINGLQDVKLK